MKVKDMTGQSFGRLTVIDRAGSKDGKATWRCKCDCGNIATVSGDVLRRGLSNSCGCLKKEIASRRAKAKVNDLIQKNTKHGMSNSRLYRIWENIKTRCSNTNSDDYHRYGGRGITVCEEWRGSFEAFRDWALANGYKDDLTIDRINNDGPYSPENCRWATIKEQSRNRKSNTPITHNGRTQTLAQWAEETGITTATLWKRLKRGWDIEKALTEPNKGGKQ